MTSFWEILKSSKSLKASDAFAELWGKSISDSWAIITITGTLPLSFLSKGEALKNYRLYGTSEGAGVQTENLYNLRLWKDTYPDNSTVVGDTAYIDTYASAMYNTGISVDIPSGYYFTVTPTGAKSGTTAIQGKLRLIDENGTAHIYYITNVNGNPTAQISKQLSFAVKKIGIDYGATMNNGFGLMQMMFTPTAPASYIPYGYKIPLTVTSGEQSDTYPVYIGDTQLMDEEYVDYESGKVWKMVDGTLTPTDPPAPFPAITAYKGENTLSSTETVGEVSVTGKIKEI